MHLPVQTTTLRFALLGLGIVGLIISARMTWSFGSAMTVDHAWLLVGVTLLAGVIPAAREFFVHRRDSTAAGIALVAFALFISIELFSHIGYTVGMRVNSVETAEHQTVVHDDSRAKVQEAQDSHAMWTKRLAALEGEFPWVASASSAALAARIPEMDKAIELEAARGGCKTKCLALMQDKGDIERRIEIAKTAETARANIEQAKATLAQHRDKSAETPKGNEVVKHQTQWASQIVSLSLDPDAATRTGMEIAISMLLALGGVAFAPTCLWLWARLGCQADTPRDPAPQVHDIYVQPTQHSLKPVTIPVELPINVEPLRPAMASTQHTDDDVPLPPRRITRVRDNAFARRVAEITAAARAQRAA